MDYEPYTMLHKYGKRMCNLGGVFIFILFGVSIFWRRFNKTVILLNVLKHMKNSRLLDMR